MSRQEQIYKKAEGDCIAMFESIERGDIIKGSICPQSYRAGFMDGAKWADQHPQLIPVEEKLPEENQRVRAWSLENNEEYLCDYHDGIFEDFYGSFTDGVITHWMEIVPPRKE